MKIVHTKIFLLFAVIVYLCFPNATGAKPDQETPSEREQAGPCGSGPLHSAGGRPAEDTQDTHDVDTPGRAEARSTDDAREVCDFFIMSHRL